MTLLPDALKWLRKRHPRFFYPKRCTADGIEIKEEEEARSKQNKSKGTRKSNKNTNNEDSDQKNNDEHIKPFVDLRVFVLESDEEYGDRAEKKYFLYPDVAKNLTCYYKDLSLTIRRVMTYSKEENISLKTWKQLSESVFERTISVFEKTMARKMVISLDEIGIRPPAKEPYTKDKRKCSDLAGIRKDWPTESSPSVNPDVFNIELESREEQKEEEEGEEKEDTIRNDENQETKKNTMMNKVLKQGYGPLFDNHPIEYTIDQIWAHEPSRTDMFRFLTQYFEEHLNKLPLGCCMVLDGGLPHDRKRCGCVVKVSCGRDPTGEDNPFKPALGFREKIVEHISETRACTEQLMYSCGTVRVPFGCATSVAEGELKLMSHFYAPEPGRLSLIRSMDGEEGKEEEEDLRYEELQDLPLPLHVFDSVDGDVLLIALLQSDARRCDNVWTKVLLVRRSRSDERVPLSQAELDAQIAKHGKVLRYFRTLYSSEYIDCNALWEGIVGSNRGELTNPVAFLCAVMMLGGNDYVKKLPEVGFERIMEAFYYTCERKGSFLKVDRGERSAVVPHAVVRYGIKVGRFFECVYEAYLRRYGGAKVASSDLVDEEEVEQMEKHLKKEKELKGKEKGKHFDYSAEPSQCISSASLYMRLLTKEQKESLKTSHDRECINRCPDLETFLAYQTYLQFIANAKTKGYKGLEKLPKLSDVFLMMCNLLFSLAYFTNAHIPRLMGFSGLETDIDSEGNRKSIYGFCRRRVKKNKVVDDAGIKKPDGSDDNDGEETEEDSDEEREREDDYDPYKNDEENTYVITPSYNLDYGLSEVWSLKGKYKSLPEEAFGLSCNHKKVEILPYDREEGQFYSDDNDIVKRLTMEQNAHVYGGDKKRKRSLKDDITVI